MTATRGSALILLALLCFVGSKVFAQETAQSQSPPDPSAKKYHKMWLSWKQAQITPWTVPSSSLTTPEGYGAQWGDFFMGVAMESRTRFTRIADGAIFAGFGVGDARRLVGFETALLISDIDNFGRNGGIAFKLHHEFPSEFAVAVGAENLIFWGNLEFGTSYYAVASKTFTIGGSENNLFSRVTPSIGIGNGRYQSQDDVINDRNTIGWFASIGLRVYEPLAVIANWSQDLFLGASIAPFPDIPLTINPAVADVTNKAGDGPRFVMSIVYGDSVFSDTFPFKVK